MYSNKPSARNDSLSGRSPASMSYEEIFKGSAIRPAHPIPPLARSPVEQDRDAYFKDVFAGPLL